MQAISLKDYPGYKLVCFRVKHPDFDVKQSIYPLLRSSENSKANPPKDLTEIVGYSLRELLNDRDKIFVNGCPHYLVQLVDENMKMNAQALIGGKNYSAAEAALKGESLPISSGSTPLPVHSGSTSLPRLREMRGNLLLGFAVFLILSFIGLAYFNREAFRT